MPSLAEVSRSRMLESVYDRFESAWHGCIENSGLEPSLDEFIEADWDEARRRDVLCELMLIDQEYRWRMTRRSTVSHQNGELRLPLRPKLEDYLARWPLIGPVEQLRLASIIHEFRLRCDAGDRPELDEYTRRFPTDAVALHEALQLEVTDRVIVPSGTEQADAASTSTPGVGAVYTTSHKPKLSRKLAPGEQLGRYRILWPIGQGAMGIVYLAYDPELDRQIALKIPFLEGSHAERLAQRFRREAKLTASLRHPNICRVLDVAQQNGIDFLTMDYIEGTSLETLLKSGPLLAPARTVQIVRKIALALQAAHTARIIHRDIKPSNILIDRQGEPVLTDFGLARREEIDQSEQTRPGEWLGTPAYMAPEQFSGNSDDVSPSCDLFSLGVVMYRLLTGQRPFGDGHRAAEVVSRKTPASPESLRVGLPTGLSDVCLRALKFDPKDRFRSANEFAAALEPYSIDSGVVNAGSTAPFFVKHNKASGLSRERSRSLVITSLACVIVATAAMVGWKSLKDDRDLATKTNSNRPANGAATWRADSRNIPRIEVHVQKAEQERDYVLLDAGFGELHDRDKVQFHVMLDEPAYVCLWYIDADGVVKQLSPARFEIPQPTSEIWEPPLTGRDELQVMHVLGGNSGMEMIVAVSSPNPLDEQALSAIERVRVDLDTMSKSAGFGFLGQRELLQDKSDPVKVQLTTLPLGADPRQFGVKSPDVSRGLAGQTTTRKTDLLAWDEFAERLTRLGAFCHGMVFRHSAR